ncbi:MAG: hypothetical protein D6706_07750 [Chloroflexi bacterium]|nr:MAG: hypothetical protein D6706_07750 [Chloroflexota bacterium]
MTFQLEQSLAQVSIFLPLQRTAPGVQVQAWQAPLAQYWFLEHVDWSFQLMQFLLHISTPSPVELQRLIPGEQVHCLLVQVPLRQRDVPLQVWVTFQPEQSLAHFSTLLPLQRTAPGVHLQVLHWLLEQYWFALQVVVAIHLVQSLEHSSTLLPLQRFCLGVQTQVWQVPLEQYWFLGQEARFVLPFFFVLLWQM